MTASAFGTLWRSARSRVFEIGRLFELAAARHPDALVRLDRPLNLDDSGRTAYTYAQLADLVEELTARLRAAGVRPGRHLAVHLTGGFEISLVGAAAARAGAVPVMLSPALDPATVRILLGRLNEPTLAVDGATLARLSAAEGARPARLVLTSAPSGPDGAPGPDVAVLRELAGAPRTAAHRIRPDDPALVTHSSGTTGVPKLMVHTSRTLYHRLLPQQLMAWPVRNEPVLLAMSFVHSRFWNSLGIFLGYGNPLAVLSETDVDTVRRMMIEFRPTVAETHPNNFVLWEDLAGEPGAPLSSVKYYSSTFDAIHPGTVKRLLAASHHRRPALVQLYGQSETGPLSGWVNTPRNIEKVDGRCIGFALPGFIGIRVVDENGRPLPRGRAGRLQVRSRSMIRTYLGEDERYRRNTDGRWWYVTDLGWKDRLGRIYLADREVDRIGEIDSNLALEDVLLDRLPELAEVVIVPGGAGAAVPVLATRGDLALEPGRWAEATAGLPALDAPLHWRFADFPRTSTWKIRRLELRALLEAGAGPEPIGPGR